MTVATSSFVYDSAEPVRAPIMVVGDTPAAASGLATPPS
jgi:hypothetical protein